MIITDALKTDKLSSGELTLAIGVRHLDPSIYLQDEKQLRHSQKYSRIW